MRAEPVSVGSAAQPPRRVAFFGGTFDPPHRGHLAVARAAADRFHLDEVLFTPAGRQPLKTESAAGFADRLRMVELACAGDARFGASALDAPHADGSPNYTAETLERISRWAQAAGIVSVTAGGADFGPFKLFAISGADSFRTLAHWREPHRLLALAEWIVVSRPGFALDADLTPEGLALSATERARIHPLNSVHDPVSASDLRRRLEAGEPCEDLLPAAVAAYIAEHKLYRAKAEMILPPATASTNDQLP